MERERRSREYWEQELSFITTWETLLRKEGYSQVMTSTQVNEEGQFFYRKLGYTDCGCLFPTNQSIMEIFLRKTL